MDKRTLGVLLNLLFISGVVFLHGHDNLVLSGLVAQPLISQQETLPALNNDLAPQTYKSLWADFDPQSEPLDIEILTEWQEDGVVLQVLRYRIGIFKGQKAMMAAVYGYPVGGTKLPGLLQIHGGGQYADYRAVLTNAKRGYATISIAWAGRISAPGYRINPDIVKLFWEGKTGDPGYKLTTDWGPLDAYHAPCRNPGNSFAKIASAQWTIDTVESPRNNSWYLCTLGARRALTFLERQPQVDPRKLGVYGHSMGGKLTVMTAAADKRIKAAAPSCGGTSDRYSDNPLYRATIGDDKSLKHIDCPIIFLNPSNDFHSRIDDLQKALREISTNDWRITCSAHHNHQDTAEYQVTGLLWFDQHLKGTFSFPRTPKSSLNLKSDNGIPSFTVTPDKTEQILSVDIYYTQQGQNEGEQNNHDNTKNRFWHHAVAEKKGDTWTAYLPLSSTDKPLWVYANVVYPLDKPVTGAGYYYAYYTASSFNLSSLMYIATSDQLKASGVGTTAKPSQSIETFEDGWEKEWFTYKTEDWGCRTHKIYDEQWKAPANAQLALEVLSEKSNKLVVSIDEYAAEIPLTGDSKWQQITLSPQDFRDISGDSLPDWEGIKELGLSSQETLRATRGSKVRPLTLGAAWKGAKPQFRNLRWITKKTGYYPEFSWETVPVAFHFGKSDSLMTQVEASFVASRSNFICLEKRHATRQFGDTETGIEMEARQLKKINPDMKVIFYWNTFLDYPCIQSAEVAQVVSRQD